jgi:predicted chitinase
MQISKGVLTELGVSPANADLYLDGLNESMGSHGISTPLRIAHFLAQVAHESMLMKAVTESFSYSAERLLKVFPKYFRPPEVASSYARKPERIANRVYANRMGNGDEASGDGYRYRGRGLIQLTGKNNYRAFSRWIGEDCLANPDLVADRFAAHSAVFYWDSNGLNALADTDNLKAITRRVNGGLNGYDDRRNLLLKAKRALNRLPATGTAVPAAPSRAPARPVAQGPEAPFTPTHRVVATALNLRKTPEEGAANRVASLAQGTAVQQIGDTTASGWAKVRALLKGMQREGFVAAKYLAALEQEGAETTKAGAPLAPTHRVAAASLNLRSRPRVHPSTRVTSLPQDTPVERLGEAGVEGWVMVRVMLNDVLREGFVAAKHLRPLPQGAAAFALESHPLDSIALPPAGMSAGKREITRADTGGRLYPLGETGHPKVSGTTPETRARQLLGIIGWLDCENPDHRRYQASGAATYANTYVCDYCQLAGVYLPRVWWTADALVRIAQEERVDVAFGRTVRELSTNALYDWLDDHGPAFGWRREIEPIDLQAAANAGEVCLVIAKSRDLNRPGHVVAVVPEHEGCQAKRDKAGDVQRPTESQCGARNVRCATASSAWWLSDKYQGYGLWRQTVGDAS